MNTDNLKQFMNELFKVAVAAADTLKPIPKALPEMPDVRIVVIWAGKAFAQRTTT